jgi:actinin alpha
LLCLCPSTQEVLTLDLLLDPNHILPKMSKQDQDWLRLQRIIFSRWVRQKLLRSGIEVTDVVQDASDGILLVKLIEALSEKKYTGTPLKPSKQRVQKIDNLNNALKFVWDSGVEMKVKPQAENFVDGDVRGVLGLVWACMLKFLRIGDPDDDQALNFKDALLLWAQNKTASYGIKVENWKNGFKDGLALCAIIHKHRPQLLNYEALNKSDATANLEAAMDAAEKYFQLEKYLTAADIQKLDENSLVVYVSEYYYGIAEQRKLDLAARRIGKVIKLTEENDAMRAEYREKAAQLRQLIAKVRVSLEDRTIDNTMAGAKNRLEQFYAYKTNEKNIIIGHQLDLETIYNNLAMRLAHNKRPTFEPGEGLSLKDFNTIIRHLEECEQERKVALHKELNRQIRLLAHDHQHVAITEKMREWIATKDAYLKDRPEINSVGSAQFQLKLLDAFDVEAQQLQENTLVTLANLKKELLANTYERSTEVSARTQEVEDNFASLLDLSKARRPELEADLAREIEKERLRLEWAKLASAFNRWTHNKIDNLAGVHFGFTLEEVETYQSVLDALVSDIHSQVDQLQSAAIEIWDQAHDLGVRENPYTHFTPNDLATIRATLDKGLADTTAAYNTELERQRVNDALCKEFASVADPFSKWIVDTKDHITNSNGSLEEQLHYVEERIAKLDEEGKRLQQVHTLQAKMDEREVTNNRHTTLIAKDVDAQWQQYQNFLTKKAHMLHNEIANEKLKGLSAEQIAEIEENFKQFDEGTGALSKKQLKACLYSLGEEKTRAQIDEIVKQRGANGSVSYESFRDFMIELLGVSDTKEDILTSFDIINRGGEVAQVSKLELVMNEHDTNYFKQTAPPAADGYDYKAWTEDVFSR